MDQHHAGEKLDLQYSDETTTPATTAEHQPPQLTHLDIRSNIRFHPLPNLHNAKSKYSTY